MAERQLRPVKAQAGRPLYEGVKDAIREAIDAGLFPPGQQMPNTKQLSEQLGVSLVTAHRALQELVTTGVLERSQGRGTFVHHRYFERRRIAASIRIGLVFHREASLGDYYHGQILDGVHQSASTAGIDLVLLRFGEDIRNECNGYLLVNPFPDEVERQAADLRRGQVALVVGAHSSVPDMPSYDVDNVEVAKIAVAHLAELGHTRIGYVGASRNVSNSLDRWHGFTQACGNLSLQGMDAQLINDNGWHLDQRHQTSLEEVLRQPGRPTALFAGGYYFALNAYGAARRAGLRVPEDLSIVGVDDPPGARFLTPAMTTVRQPLAELGRDAVLAVAERVRENHVLLENRKMPPELVVRGSTAPVSQAAMELTSQIAHRPGE